MTTGHAYSLVGLLVVEVLLGVDWPVLAAFITLHDPLQVLKPFLEGAFAEV